MSIFKNSTTVSATCQIRAAEYCSEGCTPKLCMLLELIRWFPGAPSRPVAEGGHEKSKPSTLQYRGTLPPLYPVWTMDMRGGGAKGQKCLSLSPPHRKGT